MTHTLSADEVCALRERAERAEREWAEARAEVERARGEALGWKADLIEAEHRLTECYDRLSVVTSERDEARARLAALTDALDMAVETGEQHRALWDQAQARLAALEPLVEAVREHLRWVCDCAACRSRMRAAYEAYIAAQEGEDGRG